MLEKTHFEQFEKNLPVDIFDDYIRLRKNSKVVGTTVSERFSCFLSELVDLSKNNISEGAIQLSKRMAFFSEFKLAGNKIYRIARNFGDELQKVPLSNITAENLPTLNYPICIEFPENIKFNGIHIPCVYLLIDDILKSSRPILDSEDNFKAVIKTIVLFVPLNDGRPPDFDNIDFIALNFHNSSDSVNEIILKESKTFPNQSIKIIQEYLHFVINSYLYILSGDPDLRHLKAPPKPKTGKAKKLRAFAKNNPIYDVCLVGFDYRKEIGVRGHFRWQPYGTARSLVKLIWINPYMKPSVGGVSL